MITPYLFLIFLMISRTLLTFVFKPSKSLLSNMSFEINCDPNPTQVAPAFNHEDKLSRRASGCRARARRFWRVWWSVADWQFWRWLYQRL